MTLEDLTKYAWERHHIREEHKWADFPGFSVLCDPATGKWAALLMRQREADANVQRCDIRCGPLTPAERRACRAEPPFRMRGAKWAGVRMEAETDSDAVCRLLDRALSDGEGRGYTLVLQSPGKLEDAVVRDAPLPFAGPRPERAEEPVPERIRQMRALYRYGGGSLREKAENFFRQAKFMEDYEDDAPLCTGCSRSFPTYQDLSPRQLRGYFAWRTRVRKGEYLPIPSPIARLYLFELLNGIGADSPMDSLEKLRAFEAGYLDAGFGDPTMRGNLRRWMLEFAVLNGLPPKTAEACADPELIRWDHALITLRDPKDFDDQAVLEALAQVGGKKLLLSPVLRHPSGKGAHLFSEAWRYALDAGEREAGGFFRECFGVKSVFPWHPLESALVFKANAPGAAHFVLDQNREYRCRDGVWEVEAYDRLTFDRRRLQSFLREADRLLRRTLKTGAYLKARPEDAWAAPWILAMLRAEAQAARPKVAIDLSGLAQIRRDASVTRDRLLTEEELEAAEEPPALPMEAPHDDGGPALPLSADQAALLRTLLKGGDVSPLLRERRLLPSVVADDINEALYDRFGDSVLICEGDGICLVEDYRADLMALFGGMDG